MGIGGLKSPRMIWLASLLLVASACAPAATRDRVAAPVTTQATVQAGASAADLLEIVETLAAPGMEGRATGSPGVQRAARFIAGEFERAGLDPGGEAGSYFQVFPVATGIRLGDGNRLRILGGDVQQEYVVGHDFTPFSFSDSGQAQEKVVFAGCGITAPELSYDDYAGLDAAGKIVLVLSGEPRERDPNSPFRRPEAYRYTEVRYKVLNAREHGARGVILVTNPVAHEGEPEELFAIRGITSSSQSGILVVNALRRVAHDILAGSGRSLKELQLDIDRDLRPQSFLVAGRTAEIEVRLIREHGQAWNVIGLRRGAILALAGAGQRHGLRPLFRHDPGVRRIGRGGETGRCSGRQPGREGGPALG